MSRFSGLLLLIFCQLGGCDEPQLLELDRPSEAPPAAEVAAEFPEESAGQSVARGDFTARILSWNVESEGNDPRVIARELSEFKGYDLVGLTEVLPENFRRYGTALGSDWKWIPSRSGFNDRMMIAYDSRKYEEIRRFELNDINFEDRYRAPLVAHFRDRSSGVEFLLMVNHLARGKAEVRQRQARQLVEWARDQTLPIVAIGDYNFDFVFATNSGNEAFNIFLRDNIYRWVKPVELIDSNWFDPEPDGVDNYPGSLLDFCFVAGPAVEWQAESRVIVRPGDFPDDASRSDHRPLSLELKITPRR